MIRTLILVSLLAAAGTAHAQSVPPITRAKEVAANAAKAVNARVGTQSAAAAQPPAVDTTRPAPAGGTGRPASAAARARAAAAATVPVAASAAGTAVDSVRAEAPPGTELVLMREVFRYESGRRRDPFVSLMGTGDLRPTLSDLRLVGVVYDATGRGSVAILRDMSTKDQYRVKVGSILGRMRVTQIQPKQITFAIEEFGFSRQQVLILGDTTDETRTDR
ncbi:MAG TPA: hypothetical protein VMM18_03310 [Gemmatimonadaceae bacterium]|nr:hypothetical protein [Gemmatimonadaceae bacterium]